MKTTNAIGYIFKKNEIEMQTETSTIIIRHTCQRFISAERCRGEQHNRVRRGAKLRDKQFERRRGYALTAGLKIGGGWRVDLHGSRSSNGGLLLLRRLHRHCARRRLRLRKRTGGDMRQQLLIVHSAAADMRRLLLLHRRDGMLQRLLLLRLLLQRLLHLRLQRRRDGMLKRRERVTDLGSGGEGRALQSRALVSAGSLGERAANNSRFRLHLLLALGFCPRYQCTLLAALAAVAAFAALAAALALLPASARLGTSAMFLFRGRGFVVLTVLLLIGIISRAVVLLVRAVLVVVLVRSLGIGAALVIVVVIVIVRLVVTDAGLLSRS